MDIKSTKNDKSNFYALDDLLREIGKFGNYQIFIFTLLAFPIMLSGAYSVSFVFTAGDLNYRCKIPECDMLNNQYKTDWLKYAVPYKNDNPVKCYRYEYKNATEIDICSSKNFNLFNEFKCNNFIYENDEETTLVKAVNIFILFF